MALQCSYQLSPSVGSAVNFFFPGSAAVQCTAQHCVQSQALPQTRILTHTQCDTVPGAGQEYHWVAGKLKLQTEFGQDCGAEVFGFRREASLASKAGEFIDIRRGLAS